MSDDDFGATRNENLKHPARELFPFLPPVNYIKLPAADDSSQALRHRDGQDKLIHHDSFIVDIPISNGDSGTNTESISDSSSCTESSLQSSFSNETLSISSRDALNNSSISKSTSDVTTAESSSEESEIPSVRHSDSNTNNSVGSGSESWTFSTSAKETDTLDESLPLIDSSDESSWYEEFMCQSNRNINAKLKRKNAPKKKPVSNKDKEGHSTDKDSKSSSPSSKSPKGSKERHGPKGGKPGNRSKSKQKRGGAASKGAKKSKGGKHKAHKGSKSGSPSAKRSSKHKKGKHPHSKGGKKGTKAGKGKQTMDDAIHNIFSSHVSHPASIYFILGSEFCERFTFYGLRAILVLYLTGWLSIGTNNAMALFHLFSCLAYFFPIVGAAIADGVLGRYKTILILSSVYTIGCIVLAASSFPPPELFGPVVGLFLIAIGTGGIKPCVVTFGGDQFPEKQIRQRASFFSTFYFIINIGSMLTTMVTPLLRSDVHCVKDTCYPLAFGVPAVLMTLAVIVFYAGHVQYKNVAPTGSLLCKTVCCIFHAATTSERRGRHWLDAASDKYERPFIEDVKRLTKLAWLFLPLPVFWALYNQQGSSWTLQAAQLDGSVGHFGRLKPDQMLVLNPVFIILLIPVFERLIYPCLASCGVPYRALPRMTAGMLLCAGAFCLAAFLQMKIDKSAVPPLQPHLSGYTIFNTLNCKIKVAGAPNPFYDGYIAPFGKTDFLAVAPGLREVTIWCPTTGLMGAFLANLTAGNASRLVVVSQPGRIDMLVFADKREKAANGSAYVSFMHLLAWVDVAKIKVSSTRNAEESVVLKVGQAYTAFFHVFEPGSYQVAFPSLTNNSEAAGAWQNVGKPFDIGGGGVYTVALIDPNVNVDLTDVMVEIYADVPENTLSMLLMVPQYFVMTVAEILFSISGLAFAYTQAPESMKSMIQACWLLTTSIGDVIVILVAETRLVPKQADEFLLFAAMMVGACFMFTLMAFFYSHSEAGKMQNSERIKGKGGGKKKHSRRGSKGDKHKKQKGKKGGRKGKGKGPRGGKGKGKGPRGGKGKGKSPGKGKGKGPGKGKGKGKGPGKGKGKGKGKGPGKGKGKGKGPAGSKGNKGGKK